MLRCVVAQTCRSPRGRIGAGHGGEGDLKDRMMKILSCPYLSWSQTHCSGVIRDMCGKSTRSASSACSRTNTWDIVGRGRQLRNLNSNLSRQTTATGMARRKILRTSVRDNSTKGKSFIQRSTAQTKSRTTPKTASEHTKMTSSRGSKDGVSTPLNKASEVTPPPGDVPRWLYGLVLTAEIAAGFTMAYHFIPTYVVEVKACEGPSMMPTIRSLGDTILVEKVSHRIYGLNGGDSAHDRILEGRKQQREQRRRDKSERKREEQEMRRKGATTTSIDNNIIMPRKTNVAKAEAAAALVRENDPCIRLEPESKWTPLRLMQRLRSPLKHGDVVIVQHPIKEGTVCKRILALPGDTVITREKVFWLRGDNYQHDEDDAGPWFTDTGSTVVPDGHIWLEGDNPENSRDSREYGPVPCALVQGRAVLRLWNLRGSALFGMERQSPSPKEKTKLFGVHEEDHYDNLKSRVIPAGYHSSPSE
jgi:signal peptidase I